MRLSVLSPTSIQRRSAAESRIRRALRRFRLPFRQGADLEADAAQGRAVRLFAVNYRSPWTQ